MWWMRAFRRCSETRSRPRTFRLPPRSTEPALPAPARPRSRRGRRTPINTARAEASTSWQSMGLKGDETVTIRGLQGDLKPRQKLVAEIVSRDGSLQRVSLLCRIDTLDELEYYRNGGILHYVLRKLAA